MANYIGQPLLRNGLLLLLPLYYGNALGMIPRWYERGRSAVYWALATGLWAGTTALRLVLERAWFVAGLATGFQSVSRYVLYVSLLHGMVWLVSYFLTVLRAREAAARRVQAIIGEQQAQLQHLRSRINPHFLFNTPPSTASKIWKPSCRPASFCACTARTWWPWRGSKRCWAMSCKSVRTAFPSAAGPGSGYCNWFLGWGRRLGRLNQPCGQCSHAFPSIVT